MPPPPTPPTVPQADPKNPITVAKTILQLNSNSCNTPSPTKVTIETRKENKRPKTKHHTSKTQEKP